MPYKEHHVVQLYFTIGEVSTKLNIRTSCLRFWEGEFRQLKPKKDPANGRRTYSLKDVDIVKKIDDLVHGQGYRIEFARVHLTNYLKK